eukprot:491383-Rhodomonas_salina.2
MIANTTDSELAEYLVGYALKFTLPQDFFPEDKGKAQYTISCSRQHMPSDKDVAEGVTDGFNRNIMIMDCIVISGPKKVEIGSSLLIPMSGRYSMCTAVKDARVAP